MSTMTAETQEWEAEVIDLKQQGLDTAAIAQALDKHPATIRKAVARARESGALADDEVRSVDRVMTDEEVDAAFTPLDVEPIAGQTTVDDHLEPPPEDDPEYERDPLEDFKAEAGEAVGPMPPSRAVDPQDGLFDTVWNDPDLEAVLEAREETRASKLSAGKAHKLKDDEAKTLLEKYSLAVGEVARIGRFRIKKTRTEGNEVSFATEPREQLRIAVDGGDC